MRRDLKLPFSLCNLVLPSNAISSIPPYSEELHEIQPLSSIQQLSLMDNPITSWSAIDSLATWFPHLKDLSISFDSLKQCKFALKI
jgi:Leucine-rich repeat (LRR) protein